MHIGYTIIYVLFQGLYFYHIQTVSPVSFTSNYILLLIVSCTAKIAYSGKLFH